MQTDYAGNTEQIFASAPFGDGIEAMGSGANVTASHFTGQWHDLEGGLDDFIGRYYSDAVGRFTTPDPYDGSFIWQDPQTLNRYAYVGNDPLTLIDPSGYCDGDAKLAQEAKQHNQCNTGCHRGVQEPTSVSQGSKPIFTNETQAEIVLFLLGGPYAAEALGPTWGYATWLAGGGLTLHSHMKSSRR